MAFCSCEKTGLLCTELYFVTRLRQMWREQSGSRMTWLKVADGCAEWVTLFTTWRTALRHDWRLLATWLGQANRVRVRWDFSTRFTPYAYESVPKIPSVIQPGRRWDSRAELTSPVLLHTFFSSPLPENHGVFQVESGGSGLCFCTWLFFTCGRGRARAHGETARAEADGRSRDNNGRLCWVQRDDHSSGGSLWTADHRRTTRHSGRFGGWCCLPVLWTLKPGGGGAWLVGPEPQRLTLAWSLSEISETELNWAEIT